MHHGILLVCLVASALVNFYLLWLVWRSLQFAGTLQKQRDEAQNMVLVVRYKAAHWGNAFPSYRGE